MKRNIDLLGLSAATALTAIVILAVPSWHGVLSDPCKQAALATGVTVLVYWIARARGRRGVATERAATFLFLAGMPLIYVAKWLETGGAGATGLTLAAQLAAVPIFATLAVLGLRRSPWFMAAGIAAHGVLWDTPHWLSRAPFMPDWYTIGCFVIDVGVAAYIATRVPAWNEWVAGRRTTITERRAAPARAAAASPP